MANRYVFVNPQGTGGASAETYAQAFNGTSDWGAPSGGYYSIAVPFVTHGKSLQPVVQVFELVGSDFEQVDVETVINAIGLPAT